MKELARPLTLLAISMPTVAVSIAARADFSAILACVSAAVTPAASVLTPDWVRRADNSVDRPDELPE
jgi:hypothetical protein